MQLAQPSCDGCVKKPAEAHAAAVVSGLGRSMPADTSIAPVIDLTKEPAALSPTRFAVPMVTGLGPVIDLTKGAGAPEPMAYAVPMTTGIGAVVDATKGADAAAPMAYAVPMVTGIGPVIDLTQPQVLKPLADGAVTRMVDGTAFVDLTRARVVEAIGGVERRSPDLVEPPAEEMETRDLIGPADYHAEVDTTLFPQSAVVQIHGYDAGTGIMIGPRRVLTCV